MKNKVLFMLSTAVLMSLSLTSCGAILPSVPNGDGNNENSQTEDNNQNNDQDNQTSVNELDDLVNRSLKQYHRHTIEPLGKSSFTIERSSYISTTCEMYSEYYQGGNLLNSNLDKTIDDNYSDYVRYQGNGLIDNLFYCSDFNKTNQTNYQFEIQETHESDYVQRYDINLGYRIDNGKYYYDNPEGENPHTLLDTHSMNVQTQEILDILYHVSQEEYHMSIDNIIKILQVVAFATYGENIEQSINGLDTLLNTIKFIRKDITSEDYLVYLCTRVLHINYKQIPSDDFAVIQQLMTMLQGVDANDVFTFQSDETQLTIDLNYARVMELIDSVVEALKAAAQYLASEYQSDLNDEIAIIEELINTMPTNFVFKRIFYINNGVIDRYNLKIDFDNANVLWSDESWTADSDGYQTKISREKEYVHASNIDIKIGAHFE